MARSVTNAPISPQLQHIFDRTDEEAERLREEYGDSGEALASYIREHLDRESLEEELDVLLHGGYDGDEDEELNAWQDH